MTDKNPAPLWKDRWVHR